MQRYLIKTIALILVVLTILPALSSCSTVDYEALVKDAMIYINPYDMMCEDEVDINAAINAESEEVFGEHHSARYFYMPVRSALDEKFRHPTSDAEAREFFSEGKLLTFGKKSFSVGASDYTKATAVYTRCYKDLTFLGYCTDSEGAVAHVYVAADGRLFGVDYITYSYRLEHESAPEIGIDEAMKKAVEVKNVKIANEYGLDVDFSNYELERAYEDSGDYYVFQWCKIVNGYKLNILQVYISLDGGAYKFLIYDNYIENLESNPLLTLGEKEIEKYLFPMVQEKLSDLTAKGYDIVFDHVYTPAYRDIDTSVFYFETVDKYMLYVQIEYRLVNKEKNIDYPKSASILIPIQN